MENNPEACMTTYLKRIAGGPETSKAISRSEAENGMRLILERRVSDVQAAVFLVALRMKRETDDENYGLLAALREATLWAHAPIPELVEIADPYDGFNRNPLLSLFLLPLLAACGLPAVSHGCRTVGPKGGTTHHQIISACGGHVAYTPVEGAARLAHDEIGWAYLDQSVFCPSLHRLVELRRLIVKRPSLATLEKMCSPIRAEKNYLVIGYVHPGYETQIPLIARHAGFHACLTVKGVEGGVLLPMNRPSQAFLCTEGRETHPVFFDPMEAGISTSDRFVPLPSPLTDLAATSVEMGREALSGQKGPARDALVFSASAFLYALGKFKSLSEATDRVYNQLHSGEALKRFEKGIALGRRNVL